jgi:hypothetical protein
MKRSKTRQRGRFFQRQCFCCTCLAAQEKALSYRDDEVKKAFTDINMRHAQMSRSDASRELRMHEPNVHIESEVHVARAKAMLNMADDQRREQEQRVVGKTQPARKEPPTFTKPLQNIRVKEGQSIKYGNWSLLYALN